MDHNGSWIIKPQYERAWYFSEGLAPVFISSEEAKNNIVMFGSKLPLKVMGWLLDISQGKYGYIDKKGNVVIKPEFDFVFPFSEGLSTVVNYEYQGYIDTNGNYIWRVPIL